MCVTVSGYFITHCTCICTSLDPCLSLFSEYFCHFFLFRGECLYQFSDILWLIVCPYTCLGRVFFLFLSLWLSLVVIGYIIAHCMCVCPSLGPCFSLSLTLSMGIAVFGYIVTDCSSIGTSLDRRIPLFFCLFSLSVSVYGYIIGNSACIGTSHDSYLFLSHSM